MLKTDATLVLVMLLLCSASVLAEEVMLRDGRSGDAKILETTESLIKIELKVNDGTATFEIGADRLDPHNFYGIRSKHMEQTADNHLGLAKFCIENEMFPRAKAQIEKARKLDAEKVEKIISMPEIVEGIARRIVTFAQKQLEKSRVPDAKKWASFVIARAPETEAAVDAQAILDSIDQVKADAEAATQAEAEAEAQAETSAAAGKLDKALQVAETRADEAMREKNTSRTRKGLEEAAKMFEAIASEASSAADGDADLQDIANAAMDHAVSAYLHAGETAMGQSNYNEARRLARQAQAVGSGSSAPADFLKRVDMVEALSASSGRR